MKALITPLAHAIAIELGLRHLPVGKVIERLAMQQPAPVGGLALQPAFGRVETGDALQLVAHERHLRRDLAIGVIEQGRALQFALAVIQVRLFAPVILDVQRAIELTVLQTPLELLVILLQIQRCDRHGFSLSVDLHQTALDGQHAAAVHGL